MSIYQYFRPDGIVGVGFLIHLGGVDQHSIAWPDRPAERMKEDEMLERGVAFELAMVNVMRLETANAPSDIDSNDESGSGNTEGDSQQVFAFDPSKSEAENIRNYLAVNPAARNKDVIAALNSLGMDVSSGQVTAARKAIAAESESSEQLAGEISTESNGSPTITVDESSPGSDTTGV